MCWSERSPVGLSPVLGPVLHFLLKNGASLGYYLLLRDEDPDLARALMQPDALSIPANIEAGREIRPARVGPVFSVADDGSLHMRYSARQRNIVWREDAATARATERISELLADESLVIRYQLKAGESLVSNNVLHNRSGFEDSDAHKRLMYRARYFDFVN